ncbi:MAG: phosphoribosylformylglycinamidine synthase [Bacilli bacterium]|nr:phosphoribosylformylglycinamidine synthase [Bacilli bacterium]
MKKMRLFVERKPEFNIEANELINDLFLNLDIHLLSLRYFVVYDIFDIDQEILELAINTVFSEPNKDIVTNKIDDTSNYISYEYIPGQFDQRADSAEQCLKILSPHSNTHVRSGVVITFTEKITDESIKYIKKFLINKVEAREKDLSVLNIELHNVPNCIDTIEDFQKMSIDKLQKLRIDMKLAMSIDDLVFVQKYFMETESRNPFETEIRVLDTYWSDHCRHTTFETQIENVTFDNDEINYQIEQSYNRYLKIRSKLNRMNKPITLMDIATINAKYEFSNNNLNDLEVSDEVNAASIFIDVDVNGIDERWLLMFKNETHNHPTEIEPFGGASTCIGGAIRDPLSGRSYVYSAMRVTGAGDINQSIKDTIEGKLAQKIISKQAAHGYSSYGNQIGLATTFVREYHHEGFMAKRMEIGAVIGAVKASNVRRETPQTGDIIIMFGGKTGRDGIGGATGSSKSHDNNSLEDSGAEVQKGNAPEERKIQRLFRNPEVTQLIKKSNDFGAGGVCVAIGELADGIEIDLDVIQTKYEGMNGTELAISESQERMAVVISPKDADKFMHFCHQENIDAVQIGKVTDQNRLIMKWKNQIICNISRDFINTSGVRQHTNVKFGLLSKKSPFIKEYHEDNIVKQIHTILEDPNVAEKKGLVEMFDSTIGKTTVLAPYGGKYQLTKTQTSVHKIPVKNKSTSTVSMMACGYNPYISEWSPYHGSMISIIESMSKIVASGGDFKKIYFTFQEYFEKMTDELSWSKPLASLLGAMETLYQFSLAAIGGKDSMSGTYQNLSVPPTLVSFAVTTNKIYNIISPEFKLQNSYIYIIKHNYKELYLPNFEDLKRNYSFIHEHIKSQAIVSAYALDYGGLIEALIKPTFGNKIGISVSTNLSLFDFDYGSIIVESKKILNDKNAILIGKTNSSSSIEINGIILSIEECISKNFGYYDKVFPILHNDNRFLKNEISKHSKYKHFTRNPVDIVNVLIPIFPGTNCEYDTESSFSKYGANIIPFVFNNQNETSIMKSILEFEKLINRAHILVFSGGFSSGDEPDGSGKFIANVLRTPSISEAISNFLEKKHLILGICNGFQALIKSGLLPNGKISMLQKNDPTLFKNSINRHVSKFISTKVSSISSPWLSSFSLEERHTLPVSHGEGKFIIDHNQYKELLDNNQIAFQYVDENNQPTYDPAFNPNGSSYAIEGIISKNGLILGKMAHSERYEQGLYKNIMGSKDQNIFLNAIKYFKGQVI